MPPEEGTTGISAAGPSTTSSAGPHQTEPAQSRSSATLNAVQALVALSLNAPLSGSLGHNMRTSVRQIEQPRPNQRPHTQTSPTHRTLPLNEAVPSTRAHIPPPLTHLCMATIADNCSGLVSVNGLAEELCIRILREILLRGRLDYRLCRVFIESGHEELSKAVSSLNLFDALGCGRPSGGAGLGSDCRR